MPSVYLAMVDDELIGLGMDDHIELESHKRRP